MTTPWERDWIERDQERRDRSASIPLYDEIVVEGEDAGERPAWWDAGQDPSPRGVWELEVL